jgi:hypothetical protein
MRNGKHNFGSGNLMTAQTLTDRSEVSVENVRYYTRRGLLRPVRHRKNNYRLYLESEHRAAALHPPGEKLRLHAQGNRQDFREQARRFILFAGARDYRAAYRRSPEKLDEMLELQERMETALTGSAELPDEAADGHTVCHPIESSPVD